MNNTSSQKIFELLLNEGLRFPIGKEAEQIIYKSYFLDSRANEILKFNKL
jgi:hypothetical protein